MLIDRDEAKKAMLKQQAIDLRDPALIGISFDGDLACEILDRLPAVDLVHCKDCIFHETIHCSRYLYFGRAAGGNHYCSDGKRKEGKQ